MSRNYLVSSIKNTSQIKRVHNITKSIEKNKNHDSIKAKHINEMKKLCFVQKIKY